MGVDEVDDSQVPVKESLGFLLCKRPETFVKIPVETIDKVEASAILLPRIWEPFLGRLVDVAKDGPSKFVKIATVDSLPESESLHQ